ncbi:hypothetical protein SASPL_134361 [Salvia splendens]|uniref:HAT C-terminal dimerisation domain-containing protein n=1 Tax=Salvia splendens TaxID=180675 RepID=A0A8X8ZIZ2_SALSN|nr:hypothetical protein SASPL_134361 [Salvia splendens]
MAQSCGKAISFFGVIQRIYTLFFSSTKRWKILTDNVPKLTVKSLSTTRWESRINSVQAIRYQTPQIRAALLEVVRSSTNDPKSVSDAENLVTALENFEFLCGMVIWHDILFSINMVSQKLQSKIVCMDAAIHQIEGVISYFKRYRDEGFSHSIKIATEIAEEMDVEPIFPTKRKGKRKKHFDEQNDQNEETLAAIESFRINYFLTMIDMEIASLTSRFEQMKTFENLFGFLLNSENLKSLDDNDLWKCCTTFAEAFSHDNSSDVDLNDFISELQVLQVILPDDLMSAPEIFQFITVEDCYPNVSIAYRILLTIPVTVASAERSFSKLKLLKNYLRSTMSQDRLNGLATCSIEKGILENVDLNIVLADFASRNARRTWPRALQNTKPVLAEASLLVGTRDGTQRRRCDAVPRSDLRDDGGATFFGGGKVKGCSACSFSYGSTGDCVSDSRWNGGRLATQSLKGHRWVPGLPGLTCWA